MQGTDVCMKTCARAMCACMGMCAWGGVSRGTCACMCARYVCGCVCARHMCVCARDVCIHRDLCVCVCKGTRVHRAMCTLECTHVHSSHVALQGNTCVRTCVTRVHEAQALTTHTHTRDARVQSVHTHCQCRRAWCKHARAMCTHNQCTRRGRAHVQSVHTCDRCSACTRAQRKHEQSWHTHDLCTRANPPTCAISAKLAHRPSANRHEPCASTISAQT